MDTSFIIDEQNVKWMTVIVLMDAQNVKLMCTYLGRDPFKLLAHRSKVPLDRLLTPDWSPGPNDIVNKYNCCARS